VSNGASSSSILIARDFDANRVWILETASRHETSTQSAHGLWKLPHAARLRHDPLLDFGKGMPGDFDTFRLWILESRYALATSSAGDVATAGSLRGSTVRT
jgi:hypothetical protein